MRNHLACEWPNFPNQTLLQFRASKEENQKKPANSGSDSYVRMLTALQGADLGDDTTALQTIMGPFFLAVIPEPTRRKAQELFLLEHRASVPLKKIAECIGALVLSRDAEFQEELYGEALRTISLAFGSATDDTVEDWALNTINLLTLREFSLESPRLLELVKHMQALFHVISTRVCRRQILFWLRLAADSYTFYSGMVILCSGPAEVAKIVNPLETDKIWEALYEYGQCAHTYESNPILSDMYVPFLLANQASYLLRSQAPHNDKLGTVLMHKVEKLMVSAVLPLATVMYCSCRIILLKLLHPSISIQGKQIEATNDQLINELETAPQAELAMFGLLPVVVSASCSYKQKHRETILRLCSNHNWEGTTPGRKTLFMGAIQSIWQDGIGLSALCDTDLLGRLLLNA